MEGQSHEQGPVRGYAVKNHQSYHSACSWYVVSHGSKISTNPSLSALWRRSLRLPFCILRRPISNYSIPLRLPHSQLLLSSSNRHPSAVEPQPIRTHWTPVLGSFQSAHIAYRFFCQSTAVFSQSPNKSECLFVQWFLTASGRARSGSTIDHYHKSHLQRDHRSDAQGGYH